MSCQSHRPAAGSCCRPAALALVLLALLALLAGSAPPAVAADPDPPAEMTIDPADVAGRLDLLAASLEQRGSRMALRVETGGGRWSSADLPRVAGRALCLTLAQGDPAVDSGQICVTRVKDRTRLSYTPLAADGTALAARQLAAIVSLSDAGVLKATFLPVAAGLAPGPYGWSVQSTWIDPATCPAACVDRLPDGTDTVASMLAPVGFPDCFGAAARDRDRSCQNADLQRSIEPEPRHARDPFPPICDRFARSGLLSTCEFGADAGAARETFALIGDSHAAGMKTALEAATLPLRWRGISIVRAGCPATAGRPALPTPLRSRQCATWNRQVLGWLRSHPEVGTVVLAAHATAKVKRARGTSAYVAARAGYRAELKALLRLRRRVVVLRDVPGGARGASRCISRALGATNRLSGGCPQKRSKALKRDPLAAAATALHSSRVRVIDLTEQFCDRSRCYSVIGGALVYRDREHVTPAFSASLGPFIARALDSGS